MDKINNFLYWLLLTHTRIQLELCVLFSTGEIITEVMALKSKLQGLEVIPELNIVKGIRINIYDMIQSNINFFCHGSNRFRWETYIPPSRDPLQLLLDGFQGVYKVYLTIFITFAGPIVTMAVFSNILRQLLLSQHCSSLALPQIF